MFHVIRRGSDLVPIKTEDILPITFNTREEADTYIREMYAILGKTVTYKRGPRGSRIRCHQNNMVYENIKEAAAALYVSASAISQHLNAPQRYRNVGRQYTFERLD